MSKYKVDYTSRFKKDYRRIKKRGKNIALLNDVIRMLANGETLPPTMRDHELAGEYSGLRECHIEFDWVLAYEIKNDLLVLTLTRTGTHSDLFE